MSINHLESSRAFKAKKTLRYLRLYGWNRTLWKVRSQFHWKRRFDQLPEMRDRSTKAHVGLIGCGNFGYSTIAYYLTRAYGPVLRGCMDVDIHRAASLFQDFRLDYYTDDAARILDDELIDLVYIASNHASHADYAIAALERGKSVHIEKPHVVSHDQLERLCAAIARSSGSVGLGFNRPHSRIGRIIRDTLRRQNGPAMLNWFVATHALAPDHWYFNAGEGGRIMGNLNHWTDFVYHCIPPESRFPVTITPVSPTESDGQLCVNYAFPDGSLAVITFSEKGETFEGVRERFSGHRGDALIFMDDFQRLIVEVGADKSDLSSRRRDHGHRAAVQYSYEASRTAPGDPKRLTLAYIWETANLFLKTKQALDTGMAQQAEAFSGGCGGAN